ncbi:MAG: sensor histidine kinase [Brotaphodocola sp.]
MDRWAVWKSRGLIKKKVLIFLTFLLCICGVSNLFFIYSQNRIQKEFDQILNRYYSINRFSVMFSNGITLYERYLENRTDGNWNAYKANELDAEELLQEILEDAQTLPVESFLLTKAIRNTYSVYRDVMKQGDDIAHQKEHQNHIYQIAELIQKETTQLLQENMNYGFETYNKTSAQIEMVKMISFDLMLIVTIAGIWFGGFIVERIVNPMVQLADNMEAVEREEFDVPNLPVEMQDEVGQMNRSFNSMKIRMRDIIAELKEKQAMSEKLHEQELAIIHQEKMMEQAKLLYLQSQINPHFLFNTLNVIAGMARKEHAKDTSELILSLGKIFRYNLENESQIVPLSKELTVIKSYIYIEKKRFGDRLNYILKADLDLDSCYVPPFTLQPLVENSIKHGILCKDEGGTVAIKIRENGEFVVIQVIDNGIGMSQEQKEALLYGKSWKKQGGEASGIGLENVFSRLKLVYPDTKIRILSRSGRGTCVDIWIKREVYL